MKLSATNGILYMRAALGPIARDLNNEKGLISYLHKRIDFEELFVPHFYGSRKLWQRKREVQLRKTNSGSLGRIVEKLPDSILSNHPTHAFTGFGKKVTSTLSLHDYKRNCFQPIQQLCENYDFSMLLLGCLDTSPGFSTVHAAQEKLGLTSKHLERFFIRWDYEECGSKKSKVAPESPGCSLSFGKFYDYYKKDNNFVNGTWGDASWIFIPSARRAMETELQILSKHPRFITCDKQFCTTCCFRLY